MNPRLFAIRIYRSLKRRISPIYDEELKWLDKKFKKLRPKPGEALHILDLQKAYPKEYFSLTHFKDEERWAYKINNVIFSIFKPKSVVDFGCGKGIFLKYFYNKGLRILGYEGSRSAIAMSVVPKKLIKQVDLRYFVPKPKNKFDLVISFEVAEHLEKEFAGVFTGNITSYSKRIVFSACPPGQNEEGPLHPNEQHIKYWDRLFNFYGFEENEDLTKKLRRKITRINLPLNLRYFLGMKVYETKKKN